MMGLPRDTVVTPRPEFFGDEQTRVDPRTSSRPGSQPPPPPRARKPQLEVVKKLPAFLPAETVVPTVQYRAMPLAPPPESRATPLPRHRDPVTPPRRSH